MATKFSDMKLGTRNIFVHPSSGTITPQTAEEMILNLVNNVVLKDNKKEKIMIIEDPDKKKELDKIPDVDENGEPIYKIDNFSEAPTKKFKMGELSNSADESEFKNTAQDLKDTTSQE
jgi:hypothetical protein